MKWYIPFSIIALCVALTTACKGPKGATGGDDYNAFANADKSDSLFAYIERQPCFGRCPVYKVSVYKSGYTVYDAIKWNKEEGVFEGMMPYQDMRNLLDSANAIGYFKMDDEYDNTYVTDLPTTITSMHGDGKKHRIKDRHQAPMRLKHFEVYFDSVVKAMEWKPMPADRD